MDRFIIGPKPRSILSYFVEEPAIQTSGPVRPVLSSAVPMQSAIPEPPRLAFDIFCDGACVNNGRRGARAAFGMMARRDGVEIAAVAEPLRADEPQTNQRAELRGLRAALQFAETAARSGATTVRIYTDSEYAINCLTKWVAGWKRAGWRRPGGEPVLHRDLLEPLYDSWIALRGIAFLNHVASHTGRSDPISCGNERADELARSALYR